MPKYRISARQFAWLIAAYIVSPAIINMPQHLARFASMDAWITQLLPMAYSFIICYVYYRLARLYPGKTFFEINFELAGRWGGTLINLVFLLHIWFILARDSTLFTGFIKTNLLIRTPYEITLFLLMLVIIYYGKTSLEVAARVNDIFFTLLSLVVLFLPFLLLNDMSVYQLEPVLIEPPADLGLANALSTSYYADLAAFAAFIPSISKPRPLLAASRHGVAIAAMLITWLLVTSVCVLGPNIMAREIYPTYALIQQIHITDFLDRMEIFIFSIYFPSFIVNIALSFIAILIGMTSFTKTQRYQNYSRTAGWFLLMTLVLAFGGTPEVTMFANYGLPVFVFAMQPVALVVTMLLAWRKMKQRRQSDNDVAASPDTDTDTDPSDHKRRRRFRLWQWTTHILLAVGTAAIVIGIFTAKDLQWVGRLCAAIYFIALAALVLTTFRELRNSGET